MKKYFYGNVSFVSQLKSKVQVEYMGDVASNMKYIKTLRLKMSDFQSEEYMISYEKERKDKGEIEDDEEEEQEEGIFLKVLLLKKVEIIII